MPTYEYQCRQCGHWLEVVQRMSDPKLTTCPNCQQEALEKQISAVSFQLKGTGWYETDFKNSGKPTEKSAGSTDSATTKSTKGADSTDAGKSSGGDKAAGSSSESKSESGAKSTPKPAPKSD